MNFNLFGNLSNRYEALTLDEECIDRPYSSEVFYSVNSQEIKTKSRPTASPAMETDHQGNWHRKHNNEKRESRESKREENLEKENWGRMDRKCEAYNLWKRLECPSRNSMIRKCEIEGEHLAPEDVDLLPWIADGLVIDLPDIFDWIDDLEASADEIRDSIRSVNNGMNPTSDLLCNTRVRWKDEKEHEEKENQHQETRKKKGKKNAKGKEKEKKRSGVGNEKSKKNEDVRLSDDGSSKSKKKKKENEDVRLSDDGSSKSKKKKKKESKALGSSNIRSKMDKGTRSPSTNRKTKKKDQEVKAKVSKQTGK